MKFLVLIPARYESSRFPGKPLAKIGGEEMIVRVCRQVAKTGYELAVATDNEDIRATVERAGFKAVMTASTHRSGTERVEEAMRSLGSDADVVINVQGDEPFIQPEQIEKLAGLFEKFPTTEIATLAKRYLPEEGIEGLEDPNLVKLTFTDAGEALYFSRSVIPYVRGVNRNEWLDKTEFHTHIGIYAYKASTLSELVALPPSPLEKSESLEQLRWLENGYRIRVGVTEQSTIGIDTPEDLARAEEYAWNLTHNLN